MVLKVDGQDFAIALSKFKMVNPIWRWKVRKKLKFGSKLAYRDFLGRWSLMLISKNKFTEKLIDFLWATFH